MTTNLSLIIPDNIGEYTLGRVVRRKNFDDRYIVGHIIGFGVNCVNELLIKVQWGSNDDIKSVIHPGNIELL